MEKYFEQNSNSQLIHATNTLDNVMSILTDEGLRLRYCKEDFCISDGRVISRSVHPMVCFTEQDVTQLENSKITYGKYGIAFYPKWIIENNIQPVMYLEQNSPVAHSLAKLLTHRRKLKKGNPIRLPTMTIKCFVKNMIGFNSHLNKQNFLFKEENEWRFVPRKDQIGNRYISLNQSDLDNTERAKKLNKDLSNYPLKFNRNIDVVNVYCEFAGDIIKISNKFPELAGKVKIAKWKS